jgi:AhpD family alkylhydroperoxidase
MPGHGEKAALSREHPRVSYETFGKLAPQAFAALRAFGRAADDALDKGLLELVKLRASQINGCAFCVQHHLNLARNARVEPAKLDLVAAWRDAGIFTEKERAALAWTEDLTSLTAGSSSDASYDAVRRHFTETELVLLTVAIAAINSWNRIGVGLKFAPPIPRQLGAA